MLISTEFVVLSYQVVVMATELVVLATKLWMSAEFVVMVTTTELVLIPGEQSPVGLSNLVVNKLSVDVNKPAKLR